jgi:hypothetical protein
VSRREERRRQQELAEMRELAHIIREKLANIEVTVRTDVDKPLSNDLRHTARRGLVLAEGFVNDRRLRTTEDIDSVGLKFYQVKVYVDVHSLLISPSLRLCLCL